ncbi:MAG: PEP-CTERM sorting domain-containing protein [Phycisphaeraceae bacterium]|nr:PEP-CTERM sorting domain-containing protein [Phycisphaeraceae bacterium]
MKLQRFALLTALGCAITVGQSTLAAPLIEESFDYGALEDDDDTNVAGRNGGTGFTGAWVNTRNSPDYRTAGLSAGDLDVAGGRAQGDAWSGIARPIGTTLADAGLLDNGATLWFSVIMDLADTNLSNADLNMALTNADKFHSSVFGRRFNLEGVFSEGIGAGHTGGNIRGAWWVDNGLDETADPATNTTAERNLSGASTIQLSSNGVNNPTGALIVGKIVWGADANAGEKITLYSADSSLNLTVALAETTTDALDQATFDTIAIQFKDPTPNIDEIRFGATSADVLPAVPEPGSLALLGLGGLLIARGRRG